MKLSIRVAKIWSRLLLFGINRWGVNRVLKVNQWETQVEMWNVSLLIQQDDCSEIKCQWTEGEGELMSSYPLLFNCRRDDVGHTVTLSSWTWYSDTSLENTSRVDSSTKLPQSPSLNGLSHIVYLWLMLKNKNIRTISERKFPRHQ